MGTSDIQDLRDYLQKEISGVEAYFRKDRELSRDCGWGAFSGAKGNLVWVRDFIRHMDRLSAEWEGSEQEYLERMHQLHEEVKPDDDYKWPSDARTRVKAILERARQLSSRD